MKVLVSCLILAIAFSACRKADQTRLNRISYSVENLSSLPIDTAHRFDVSYLQEWGMRVLDTNIYRFSYSFSVEGEGEASLYAISRDSTLLRVRIVQNGNVIREATGYEPSVQANFH